MQDADDGGDVDDDDDDDDEEDDDGRLASLVSSITSQEGGRGRGAASRPERIESRPESEFHLVAKQSVGLDEMLSALPAAGTFGALRKKLGRIEKSDLKLSKPVSKAVTEKATREAAYDMATEDVTKWLPSVKANRESEQLVFPPEAPKPAQTATALAEKFVPTTALEQQVKEQHQNKI
jgi:U3 small nucleolar RNA-associated protein 14